VWSGKIDPAPKGRKIRPIDSWTVLSAAQASAAKRRQDGVPSEASFGLLGCQKARHGSAGKTREGEMIPLQRTSPPSRNVEVLNAGTACAQQPLLLQSTI
jgi:hypothetical protein